MKIGGKRVENEGSDGGVLADVESDSRLNVSVGYLNAEKNRVDSGAPVHDPGMIKDFDALPFRCQQPLPVCAGSGTSAAAHEPTAGAENGKQLSRDGKTECAISICMEGGGGATDHLRVQ